MARRRPGPTGPREWALLGFAFGFLAGFVGEALCLRHLHQLLRHGALNLFPGFTQVSDTRLFRARTAGWAVFGLGMAAAGLRSVAEIAQGALAGAVGGAIGGLLSN